MAPDPTVGLLDRTALERGTAISSDVTGTLPVLVDMAVPERVNRALRQFFAGQLDFGEDAWREVVSVTVDFVLGGGKRIRPEFCYWGWRGAGGPDNDVVIAVAASLELLHAFALIHDDIMDASTTRRGRPTVHRSLSRLHERNRWLGAAERFGVNVAILCGDLCAFWSDALLHGSGLSGELLAAIRPLLDQTRTELCVGQYLDLSEQASGGTMAGALRVIQFKAARYTVARPLQIGGVLAGAGPAVLAAYRAYGLPIGEAFQLRDDLLGVFGDPAKTGKAVLDDLRDGKATVLMAVTRDGASPAQRARIARLHGSPSLDEAGAGELRDIIVTTGAPDRVESMIDERVTAGLAALDGQPDLDPTAAQALRDLAIAATRRQL